MALARRALETLRRRGAETEAKVAEIRGTTAATASNNDPQGFRYASLLERVVCCKRRREPSVEPGLDRWSLLVQRYKRKHYLRRLFSGLHHLLAIANSEEERRRLCDIHRYVYAKYRSLHEFPTRWRPQYCYYPSAASLENACVPSHQ